MKFTQLRLVGFKSFVDPAELRIDPGLTGVIGPNGCGKSNLLEALRWVMGATSAKSLRGGGMEDVIFAGTDARPGRDRAEVTLSVDNSDHTAPARFNDAEMLEVVRRITRGKGSDYRINGEEVRAKDVQLLFADAGTGANSPALVRQGQISELINAKPENRRRVLEEAAGVAGLRARRREAQLKLNAAEANLDRLGEVIDELETRWRSLQRQAREASRYRKLSQDIRALEAVVWLGRWTSARQAEAEAEQALAEIEQVAAQAMRAAASATSAAEAAGSKLQPLREAEAEAAAALRLIERERDGLERDVETAKAEIERLGARAKELAASAEREDELAGEAREALERAASGLARVRDEAEGDAGALERAEAALKHADKKREEAEARLDQRAGAAADARAARAAATRDAEAAAARAERAGRALEEAKAALEAAGAETSPDLEAAEGEAEAARAAVEAAREAYEAAEARAVELRAASDTAAAQAREAKAEEDALSREHESLSRMLAGGEADADQALDQVAAKPGYEQALAAALGDELEASLSADAQRRWAGSPVRAEGFAGEATPLSDLVEAPDALSARLAAIGVVEDEAALDALAASLQPGQRLVTKEGAIRRWDGYASEAGAPSAAALRLETRNRIAEIEAELEPARARRAQAADAAEAAAAALHNAEAAEREARQAARESEAQAAEAERKLNAVSGEAARAEARHASLAEALQRAEAAFAEAGAEAERAEAARAEAERADDGSQALEAARAEAETARATAADARAALESVKRDAQGRRHRIAALEREEADWTRRAEAASARSAQMKADQAAALEALETARGKPGELEARREALYEKLGEAESRARLARDAVAEAEAGMRDADGLQRAAEKEASQAREARAGAAAKLEAARERVTETRARLEDATGETPEALSTRADDNEYAGLSADEVERRLDEARLARERLGAVNLRADAECEELQGERERLTKERDELIEAVSRLRKAVDTLSREGRARLMEAFETVDGHFRNLFETLFGGGRAELHLTESEDPLEAGLEIMACPPGKKLESMSLMSGGEQALTATALIFAVFLSNPAPVCVLDEVDAPLDDANVDRFCRMLDEMRRLTETRFLVITHNAVTMSRMDRLFGVTMAERGVSQLVSVNLKTAEALAAAE